jgi:hypothetical protein
MDQIEDIGEALENAAAGALWQNAQDVQRVASTKIPVKTGHLRRSYVVDVPRIRPGAISVVVGYGAHYALWVHERTELTHTNGQAKFLTVAIDEEAGDFAEKLAKRTAALAKKGGGLIPQRDSGPDYNGSVD